MDAVAWVLGIGITIGLFVWQPKRTAIVFAVVVGLAAVAAGVFLGVPAWQDYRERQTIAQIIVTTVYFLPDCTPGYPIKIDVTNRTDRTIEKVMFTLDGLPEGRSSPLYDSGFRQYSSDVIIKPHESYSLCWSMPNRASGQSDDRFLTYPAETLVWEARDIDAVFAD